MGTTTSNEDKGITTTTSDHKAVNTEPDICWNPPVTVQVPCKNEVETKKATGHTSPKTVISEGMIVRVQDAIGPPSVADPAGNTGNGGGVTSHTYQMEAKITTGSKNVTAEDKPVGRQGDPTSQNHVNTVGHITGSNPTRAIDPLRAEELKRCSLEEIEVDCGHGREPGKDGLLEIITEDDVEFHAHRINAKDKNKGPECEERGRHTKWIITRTKSGKQEKQETKYGDKIKLDNSWFTWGPLDETQEFSLAPEAIKRESETEARDRTKEFQAQRQADLNDKLNSQWGANRKGKSARRDYVANQRRQADKAGDRDQRNLENKTDALSKSIDAGMELYKATTSLMDLWKVWNADKDVVEVTVEAFACSGAKKYVIRSFPGKGVSFSVSDDTIKKIKAAVEAILRLIKGIQKAAAIGGLKSDFELHFLDNFKFKFSAQWKEMKKDVEELKKYKHHCDLSWKAEVKTDLIKWKFFVGVPALAILNAFVPGAGSALDTLLSYFNIESDAGLDVKFAIGPEGSCEREPGEAHVKWDMHWVIECKVFIRARFKWRDSVECQLGVQAEGEPKLQVLCETWDLFTTYIKVEKGDIKFGLVAWLKVDTWFWHVNERWEYYPESFRVKYDEFNLKPFALLKG